MKRLEVVRQVVDKILNNQENIMTRRCGYIHLYGVALFCTQLSMRRDFDMELATTAGMLHDIATYTTSDSKNHAARSAIQAREILTELAIYSEEEINTICQAIHVHSDKNDVGGPLDELLKDADVLHNYLDNPGFGYNPKKKERLRSAMEAIGLTLTD
jgi:uncharacterized protein